MSLDYSAIQEGLEAIKSDIDELVNYMKINKQTDMRDIEVYAKLAEISANILQCDRSFLSSSK